MSQNTYIFKRIEKKYKITDRQRDELLQKIQDRLMHDSHNENTVCSLYLDTPTHLLIRNSIDAKVYKEKIRIRSYGAPEETGQVFLELKKKFKGTVYKRRICLTLKEAEEYVYKGAKPFESQIMSEIDYAMKFYDYPKPAMLIAYEREAFYAKGSPDLRLTFDSNIRYRDSNLDMKLGTAGKCILPEGMSILEIKADGAMPIWLADSLDECNILPTSFSKYATSYRELLSGSGQINCKGGYKNVCNF